MKKLTFPLKILSVLLGVFGLVILSGCTNEPEFINKEVAQEKSQVLSGDGLTTDEISSLMYMVEEEKLAMDVYAEMFELYGLVIFDNINQSEFRHVNAVSELILKYELENPIAGKSAGEFENEELLELYNNLIVMGTKSKVEAINVGIMIEEKDMVDIEYYLDLVESKDLEQVYSNLLSGSENHLAAFEAELL